MEADQLAKVNFLKMLIDAKCCSNEVTSVGQLKRKERERYQQLVESYKYQEYSQGWQAVLAKHIDYKHARIIGDYSITKGTSLVRTEAGSERGSDLTPVMSEKEV